MEFNDAAQKLLSNTQTLYVSGFIAELLENYGNNLSDKAWELLLSTKNKRAIIQYEDLPEPIMRKIIQNNFGEDLINLARRDKLPTSILQSLWQVSQKDKTFMLEFSRRSDLPKKIVSTIIRNGHTFHLAMLDNHQLNSQDIDYLIANRSSEDVGLRLAAQKELNLEQIKQLAAITKAVQYKLIKQQSLPTDLANKWFKEATDVPNVELSEKLIESCGAQLTQDNIMLYIAKMTKSYYSKGVIELLKTHKFSANGFTSLLSTLAPRQFSFSDHRVHYFLAHNPFLDKKIRAPLLRQYIRNEQIQVYRLTNLPSDIMDMLITSQSVEMRRQAVAENFIKINEEPSFQSLATAYKKERSTYIKDRLEEIILNHSKFKEKTKLVGFARLNFHDAKTRRQVVKLAVKHALRGGLQ